MIQVQRFRRWVHIVDGAGAGYLSADIDTLASGTRLYNDAFMFVNDDTLVPIVATYSENRWES